MKWFNRRAQIGQLKYKDFKKIKNKKLKIAKNEKNNHAMQMRKIFI